MKKRPQQIPLKRSKKYKRKLCSFLKSYREQMSLSQRDMAKLLNMSPPRYCELENPEVIELREGPFINAINYLANFEAIEHMSVPLFIDHIFSEETGFNKRKIHLCDWQQELLDGFFRLNIFSRNTLLKIMRDDSKKFSSRMEGISDLLAIRSDDYEDLVQPLLNRLKNNGEHEKDE